MGGDSEIDGLLKWLEESGRALELRTMRAFRRYAEVQHSVHYADQDSGKVRESDVLARFYGSRGGNRLAHLDVVVECKTGKPGSQWVAFLDGSSPSRFDPDQDAWVTAREPTKGGSRFTEAWKWYPPFTERVNVSSIVTAHDGRATAHAAIQQCLSAVEGQIGYVLGHEDEPYYQQDEATGIEQRWSKIDAGVLGLVITTVPLYVADLDEDNAPRVKPVEIVAVPSSRQAGPARVFVANETALNRIVMELHKAADRL
jgi:hypothetical protein